MTWYKLKQLFARRRPYEGPDCCSACGEVFGPFEPNRHYFCFHLNCTPGGEWGPSGPVNPWVNLRTS